MKVAILAGGFGTRLSEETEQKPKPMVEIGGRPILWHIMKSYSSFGYDEFVILLGYKGYLIKEYFANYFLHNSDVTVDLKNNNMEIHSVKSEPWKVTLLDTGIDSLTGERIRRAAAFLEGERFMLTYGDGVGDVDLDRLLAFHEAHGRLLTMTTILPDGRFGAVSLEERDGKVTGFREKPAGENGWINGGFFVCEPRILDYIQPTNESFEQGPLTRIAEAGELHAYRHRGFWKCMDTLRDKHHLEELAGSGNPPWLQHHDD